MAVINTIRNYSYIAIFFIAISIFAFILADVISQGGGALFGGPDRSVGEIKGEQVNVEEFNAEVERLKQNMMMAGQNPTEEQMTNIRQQAWNNLIFQKAYNVEFEELGITVSDKELTQMVQGDSLFIHPWIRQQFQDSTQKFNKAFVINYLTQIEQNPYERVRWANFESEMIKERLRRKYEGLVKLSSYVTSLEAEREYQGQNTKAEVKYFYVPYTSIPDSTLKSKVTDAQLEKILKENPDKYKASETRSLEYVVFDIKPSKQDSTEFLSELKELAKNFAKAPNDTAFVELHSDQPQNTDFQTLDKIPSVLFEKNPTILKGGIYGPYLDGKTYKIFKVSDIKEDSVAYARASHILISAEEGKATAEEMADAQKRANDILKKLQDGEDFAKLARENSEDGSAASGGDLGFFPKGRMVAPFENAVFARENPGLVPNLVKSQFGYHIIKVTYPASNKQYKLATVDRVLDPGSETREEVFRKAEELASQSENAEDLRSKVEKNPALVLLNADKLPTNATSLGSITGAREVIRWAFNDAEIGSVSEVFDIQDQNKYLIAILKSKTSKDEGDIEIFREQLTNEAIKELKKKAIEEKINLKAKSLEEMAEKYGKAALVNTANELTLNANVFPNVGYNPQAIGQAIGLKKGKRSGVIADETGVFVIEKLKETQAAEVADYSQYITTLKQRIEQRVSFLVNETLREASDIEDMRYKFY